MEDQRMSQRVLNVGLIGGGAGAFIVNPHQRALHSDGTRRVICGALHYDPVIAIKCAEEWPYPIRGYRTYDEMIHEESRKPLGERIDYALIVTPNHVHFDPAIKCIQAGIPVFCEKPMTLSLEEADQLVAAISRKPIPFGVAHTYLGHWTSLFSRHVVRSGLLGEIRWVDAFYLQGWLAGKTEEQGVQQAVWRVDPKQSGLSCCGGDIGTHALMQLRFVTGLEITELRAHMETFVSGRQLDDHFTAYLKLNNGARGLVRASQIAIGHKNDLGLEVCGTRGTLTWRAEDPEKVTIHLPDQPDRVYWRGVVQPNDGFLGEIPDWILKEPTIPSGHPEAFHDAYARLHRFFEADVRAYNEGRPFASDGTRYANVLDGRIGIAFVATAYESNQKGNAWVPMK
jgi:predicted dehydrogenase